MPKPSFKHIQRPQKRIGNRTVQLDSGWELRIWDALLQQKTAGNISHVSRTPYGLQKYGSKKPDTFTFYQFPKEKNNKVKEYRTDFLITVTNAEALNKFFNLEVEEGDSPFIEGFQIIEIKGRMLPRSRHALLKMRKYYPRVHVVVLRERHLKGVL